MADDDWSDSSRQLSRHTSERADAAKRRDWRKTAGNRVGTRTVGNVRDCAMTREEYMATRSGSASSPAS